MVDAADYFTALHEKDELPGIHCNEVCKMSSEPVTYQDGEVVYPATVILRANKAKDKMVYYYYYEVSKETPAASWQLVRARRTDKNGNVIEQLLPK